MSARVLVVDDVVANVKLLHARLTAEYFEVVTATTGDEALRIAREVMPDIILLDVMMPDVDGLEVCRQLKSDLSTQHIPVILITSLDTPADRVQGFEAGADDFLPKPIDDVALMARVRSLVRLKMVTDELRSRASTGERMGIVSPLRYKDIKIDGPARILLVDDRGFSIDRLTSVIGDQHELQVESDPNRVLKVAATGNFDLLIVSLGLTGADGLRLCSHLKSDEDTRTLPVLVLSEPEDSKRLARALDIGVNDYLVRPIERNELLARVRTQLRHSRYAEQLRSDVEQSMQMAITDQLTGLHNRRYMENHLSTHIDTAIADGKDLSILLFDIDHFKPVNDIHGHAAGDAVLAQIGNIVNTNTRGSDFGCRYGGEEFVVIMPGRETELATFIAERLRQTVSETAFIAEGIEEPLKITISIGVASLESKDETPLNLLRRADKALYTAKEKGRNCVVVDEEVKAA